MRRLLVLISTFVFFDVVFYTAIAPLLPDYVQRFGLSESAAGVLIGAYAAGTLVAALPAGWLASRLGPRRIVIAGLLLLGVASATFGFGWSIAMLDAARFAQGVAGALIWAGSLAWLVAATAPERRGSTIGTTLGTAVAGALIGPVLGSIAAAVGTEPVFGGVLALGGVFAVAAARLPEPPVPERQPLSQVAAALTSRPLVFTTALVALPSVMFGAVGVLVPLRIHDLGGGHVAITVGFVSGAALEAALAPISGRYSDRAGRRAPIVVGIGLCAVAMAGIGLAQELNATMIALVSTSLGAGLCISPALTALSESAESKRLHQGYAAGLSNMAWSFGQVSGAMAGGGAAAAVGLAVPSLAVTALMLATAVWAYRTIAPGRPARERYASGATR